MAGVSTFLSAALVGRVSRSMIRNENSLNSLSRASFSARAVAIKQSRRSFRLSVENVSNGRAWFVLSVYLICTRSRNPVLSIVVRSSNRSFGTSFLSIWAVMIDPSMRSMSRIATSKSWYSYPLWAYVSDGNPLRFILYCTLDWDIELSFLLIEKAHHDPETSSVHPRVHSHSSLFGKPKSVNFRMRGFTSGMSGDPTLIYRRSQQLCSPVDCDFLCNVRTVASPTQLAPRESC